MTQEEIKVLSDMSFRTMTISNDKAKLKSFLYKRGNEYCLCFVKIMLLADRKIPFNCKVLRESKFGTLVQEEFAIKLSSLSDIIDWVNEEFQKHINPQPPTP